MDLRVADINVALPSFREVALINRDSASRDGEHISLIIVRKQGAFD